MNMISKLEIIFALVEVEASKVFKKMRSYASLLVKLLFRRLLFSIV